MKFKCPSCKNKVIQLWKIYWLIPFRNIKCGHCKAEIGVLKRVSIPFNLLQFSLSMFFFYLLIVYQESMFLVLLFLAWFGLNFMYILIPKRIVKQNNSS